MKDTKSSLSVAVIGAGMAGIGAARVLVDAGCRVVVFEKSRGLGGRCATKRWEGQTMDHGAQYFTMRDVAFRQAVESACGEDLRQIEAPIVAQNGQEISLEERFFHAQGNSRLARALAGDLDIRSGIELALIVDRRIGEDVFDVIISTAPLPQTARLAGLEKIENPYAPCLTLLLLYEAAWPGLTRTRYALSDHSGHPLAWSACENHKTGRISENFTAMVVQTSLEFSRARLEEDSAIWSQEVRALAEERWELPASSFRAMHPHRWRYARVGESMLVPELPEGWHFAGDLITESRVESAWLAGRRVAEKVIS